MMVESRSHLKGQQYVIVSFCLMEQVLFNLPRGFPQPVICLDLTSCVLSSHTNSLHVLTHRIHKVSSLLFHQASHLPLPTSASTVSPLSMSKPSQSGLSGFTS